MQQNVNWRISSIISASAIVTICILFNLLMGKQLEVIAQQTNCANPGSNVEWKLCTAKAYQAADRRLNQVYKRLYNQVNGDERKELIKAQQNWIKFRDTNCLFEVYSSRRGSGYSGFLNNCLERMTKERTTQLERYIQERSF
ncbi:lysozyme inhibitor LprI family protein [Calothrix sp. NIES-3974]|uniref:lysozyme inhibitor LprI family protein n=1 Tax=Calothrix sp. NIES-3974 TaxID=2005462 RepID=UPI000B5DD171|nr:lysozyme inhibitor LprI family protein [Calothrix sp. NIES-3974]BAZ07829.1 hypothetical protein NIES3974_44940 [Calothrix sp. NIES-3974]